LHAQGEVSQKKSNGFGELRYRTTVPIKDDMKKGSGGGQLRNLPFPLEKERRKNKNEGGIREKDLLRKSRKKKKRRRGKEKGGRDGLPRSSPSKQTRGADRVLKPDRKD